MTTTKGPMDHEFTAVLDKRPGKGGWTCVHLPGSVEMFGKDAGDEVVVHLEERLS